MTARPYIQHFEASGFGCLVDVKMELTRLHALIGPNDSGKSTILQAIQFVFKARGNTQPSDARFRPGSRLRVKSDTSLNLGIGYFGSGSYQSQWRGDGPGPAQDGSSPHLTNEENEFVYSQPTLVRWDPDLMREPSTILSDRQPLTLADGRGRGLVGIYDRIRDRDDDGFRQIVAKVQKLFPTVKKVSFSSPIENHKAFEVELVDGTKVRADHLSEGLLYFLGFAAIQHVEPSSILLVEEPENGLHPSRVADVVRILREISATTQVILATHSPLVVNELNADEVTVVTRTPEKGTQTLRLADTPHFAERSKVYALGELWLSYANGVNESPLLTKTEA